MTEQRTVYCLRCDNSIELVDRERQLLPPLRVTPTGGRWYSNGLTLPGGQETLLRFYLCPEHQTMEDYNEAWVWAHTQARRLQRGECALEGLKEVER